MVSGQRMLVKPSATGFHPTLDRLILREWSRETSRVFSLASWRLPSGFDTAAVTSPGCYNLLCAWNLLGNTEFH